MAAARWQHRAKRATRCWPQAAGSWYRTPYPSGNSVNWPSGLRLQISEAIGIWFWPGLVGYWAKAEPSHNCYLMSPSTFPHGIGTRTRTRIRIRIRIRICAICDFYFVFALMLIAANLESCSKFEPYFLFIIKRLTFITFS